MGPSVAMRRRESPHTFTRAQAGNMGRGSLCSTNSDCAIAASSRVPQPRSSDIISTQNATLRVTLVNGEKRRLQTRRPSCTRRSPPITPTTTRHSPTKLYNSGVLWHLRRWVGLPIPNDPALGCGSDKPKVVEPAAVKARCRVLRRVVQRDTEANPIGGA